MEGDRGPLAVLALAGISIHTLRMEGDARLSDGYLGYVHFNPHPPHGG